MLKDVILTLLLKFSKILTNTVRSECPVQLTERQPNVTDFVTNGLLSKTLKSLRLSELLNILFTHNPSSPH
jgi:hypothetical protein